jgi:hypothetical protein
MWMEVREEHGLAVRAPTQVVQPHTTLGFVIKRLNGLAVEPYVDEKSLLKVCVRAC